MAAKKRTPTPAALPPRTSMAPPSMMSRPNASRVPKKLNYFQRTWIWYEGSFAISMLETVSHDSHYIPHDAGVLELVN